MYFLSLQLTSKKGQKCCPANSNIGIEIACELWQVHVGAKKFAAWPQNNCE